MRFRAERWPAAQRWRLGLLPVGALLTGAAWADLPAPLPPAQWPATVQQAVPRIIERLTPTQTALVRGTPREDIFLLQGEWGDDIVEHLGLARGNAVLLRQTCGPCTLEQATLRLMQASWDALQRSRP